MPAANATNPSPESEDEFKRRPSGLQIALSDDIRAAAADWKQLAATGFGNPYQSPGWLAAWSETIGRDLGIDPVIVTVRLDGKPALVLPLGIQNSAGTRTLSFLGHQHGNQNTAIWDADFYRQVGSARISELLAHVCEEMQADLLLLQNVPGTWHGRAHPLVLDGATPSPSPIFTRRLCDDFDALFRETHSKSSRKNLLRKQRHLQSVDGYRVVRAETEADLRSGFEAFLAQREKRAQEAGIPNVFSDDAARRFLEELLGLNGTRNASRELDLWFLEADGRIRATYLCANGGGTIHAYSNSVAHDELLPNSPGLVLIKEIIEHACLDPKTMELDLGLGEERYKTSWAEPVPLADSRLAVSLKGNIRKSLEVLRLQAKSAVRNSDVLWPLVRQMRRWKSTSGGS
ncbi:GNAT family N-acetyltransferase [Roseibium sp. MMSF_3412]|uniref:GNAT family N-acetyltransferase n=1 Tax=Roseibium sp. MMSF_3412 TaxID=3046712 RepID=UPI00273E6FD5|nr:GNAT family N-acetyltransferase [Roseibium sp. MMSF_3412]